MPTRRQPSANKPANERRRPRHYRYALQGLWGQLRRWAVHRKLDAGRPPPGRRYLRAARFRARQPMPTARPNGQGHAHVWDDATFTLTVTNLDTGRYKSHGHRPQTALRSREMSSQPSYAPRPSTARPARAWSIRLSSTAKPRRRPARRQRLGHSERGLATAVFRKSPALQICTAMSTWATATGYALASVWTSGLASTIATNLYATVSVA